MNCVVTAGPTFEPLDQVRRLTNFSTGHLGAGLAEHLTGCGHDVHLFLGEMAVCQVPTKVQCVTRFSTTADLETRLAQLAGTTVGAVFHAAAVSDFTPSGLWTRGAAGELMPIAAGKVPSQTSPLWLELKPAPKILARLGEWFPKAIIVAWKYEVDGTREQAVGRGRIQIATHSTAACVVNGPAYGPGYALIEGSGEALHLGNLPQLYKALARLIGS